MISVLVVIAPLKCVRLVDMRSLVGLVVNNEGERGSRGRTVVRKDAAVDRPRISSLTEYKLMC